MCNIGEAIEVAGEIKGLVRAVLTYVKNTGTSIEEAIRLLVPDADAAIACRQYIEENHHGKD